MTISRRAHPYAEEVPEGKRLRMKDWLKSRIGDPRYPGLVWLDKEKNIFRIPWKHAALHGWDQNSDGALFRDWAEHTGACVRNAQPKQLKATFRCALHSLPDVHEDKNLAKKRGDDACRVYRFDDSSSAQPTKKRLIRIRNHRDKKGAGSGRWTARGSGPQAGRRSSVDTAQRPALPPYMGQGPYCGSWVEVPHAGPQAPAGNANNNNSYGQDFLRRNSLGNMTLPLGSDPFYQPQRYPYSTQSNPDITHSLLPAMLNLNPMEPMMVDRPTYLGDAPGFPQSYSVPEMSTFANPENVYETMGDMRGGFHPSEALSATPGDFAFPKMENRRDFDLYSMSGTDVGSSSLSPGTSGYSPSHSSMASSPNPLSPAGLAPLPQQRLSTVAEAVASASAVVDCYQSCIPSDIGKDSLSMQPTFYEDKLIDSVEAFIASGAIQLPTSKQGDMFSTSPPLQHTLQSPEYDQNQQMKGFFAQAESDPLNLSFKDFPQATSEAEAEFAGHLREICHSSFLAESDASHHHILATVSTDVLPPTEHSEPAMHADHSARQFTPEPQLPRSDDCSQWFASPTHQESALPSASTLLSPSHSPSYGKKAPLTWIPVSESPDPERSSVDSPQALQQTPVTYGSSGMYQISPAANQHLSTVQGGFSPVFCNQQFSSIGPDVAEHAYLPAVATTTSCSQ